jgi:intracellular sulfur oxidation DsrE/DsrF family protein
MAVTQLLIHAPTVDALKRAQNNARNLLKLEPDAQVEIVVNGPATALAVTLSDEDILSRLVICRNSLQAQTLSPQPQVKLVDAAVQYLAHQQMKGWSYMRA